MTIPYQAAAAPMPAPQAPTADLPRLLQIARHQRGIMSCILASIAVGIARSYIPLPDSVDAVVGVVATALVGLACVYFTVRLANAVFGVVGAVLCALVIAGAIGWELATLQPYLRLVVLAVMGVVSVSATRVLRKAGFKVGLMGGDPRDVEKRMQGMAR